MSRDTEINELKQSLLAMRQTTHHRGKRQNGTALLRRSRPRNARPASKTAMKGGLNDKVVGSNEKKKTNDENSATTNPSTIKSIRVEMPQTKTNDKNCSDGDDRSGVDIDSSLLDNTSDGDDISDHDSVDNSKATASNRQTTESRNGRPISKMSTTKSASTMSTRHHGTDKGNNNKDGEQIKHTGPMGIIMARLKLDKLPPSWYTQVVPASDVHVAKRVIGVDDVNLTQPNYTSRKLSSKSRKQQSLQARSAKSAGDIYRQDPKLPMQRKKSQLELNVKQKPRPFTTIGVRSWGSGDDGIRGQSRERDSLEKSSHQDERPHTVLFCEQTMHGNTTKTMRQLKEEEMQFVILNNPSPLDILLGEMRAEQKVIDEKVKRFVKSLDEERRSERLKKLMSETNLIRSTSPL